MMDDPHLRHTLCSAVVAATLLGLPAGTTRADGAPALQAAGPTIRISVGPPTNQADIKPPPPSPQHLWLPGYWNWQDGRHVWVRGHWEPPKDKVVWVAPQWVFQGQLWTFYPGHWLPVSAPPPATDGPPPPSALVVKQPPPPHRIEVVPARPSPQQQWAPGHWDFQGGRFLWIAGHWMTPRPGWVWEGAHWRQAGKEWRFVPGHWRHS